MDATTDILESCYNSALLDLKRAILLIRNRKVKTIAPEYQECQEQYPCSGHGCAIITLYNIKKPIHSKCGSVGMAAIMWFYKIKDKHFIDYIDEDFERFLIKSFET